MAKNARAKNMEKHSMPIKKLVSNKVPILISTTHKILKKAKRTLGTHKYAVRLFLLLRVFLEVTTFDHM